MELSSQQRTFVAAVVVIAIIVAVGTLIFACIWCLLDQDGLLPAGWCNWFGTPKDTFSPNRWWMEALAQRVENLEAGQPLMERKGRRKKVGLIYTKHFVLLLAFVAPESNYMFTVHEPPLALVVKS